MLKNMNQLHKLYAQVPGILLHHTIFPFRYMDEVSGEEKEECLIPSDIIVYMVIYINSDMRGESQNVGTAHKMSAKDIEDALRPEPKAKPVLRKRAIYNSLKRLRRGGFIFQKLSPSTKTVWKISAPDALPSRQRIVEAQIEARKLAIGAAELAKLEKKNAESQKLQNETD